MVVKCLLGLTGVFFAQTSMALTLISRVSITFGEAVIRSSKVFIELRRIFHQIITFSGLDKPARLELIRLPEIAGVVMKEG